MAADFLAAPDKLVLDLLDQSAHQSHRLPGVGGGRSRFQTREENLQSLLNVH